MSRICINSIAAMTLMACPVVQAQWGHLPDDHGRVLRGSLYYDSGPYGAAVHVVSEIGRDHGTFYLMNGQFYYRSVRTAALPGGARVTGSSEIVFGGCSHVDELAFELEVLLNDLCLDLYYNYSHNPDFHTTYVEAYDLLQVAKFMHAAEHQNDREAMRNRLAGADALLHHLQDDVCGWTVLHRRHVGRLDTQTRFEVSLSTLHHLMNDVGVRPVETSESAPPPLPEREGAPAPGSLPIPVLER
jgi:hypothetical protein